MSERDRDTPFSFGEEPPSEEQEREQEKHERWQRLGRRLSLGGVVLVLLATLATGIYVYRPDLVVRALEGTLFELPATVTRAYKWRDSAGDWQISDRPPTDGTPYEVLEVRGDQNVMPLAPPTN